MIRNPEFSTLHQGPEIYDLVNPCRSLPAKGATVRISYPNICQAKWHFYAYLSDHFHMISLFLPRSSSRTS